MDQAVWSKRMRPRASSLLPFAAGHPPTAISLLLDPPVPLQAFKFSLYVAVPLALVSSQKAA